MHAQVQDVGEDLEQVEVMQKKFDDFQNDLRANEVRLAEMNEIAVQLMTVGQTEAALKIRTQMQVCTKPFKRDDYIETIAILLHNYGIG